MNDSLRYFRHDPVHRKHHQNELSFRMIYAFTENFILPLSHDEVVHGKRALISQMPGDDWQRFANLRVLLGYQYTTPGKTLLFMGGEFAQWHEWNHDSQLDWHLLRWEPHRGLQRFVRDLNTLVRGEPALHELDCTQTGFSWIHADDAANSIYSYCRHATDPSHQIVVVLNMTPVPRNDYRVGVPRPGYYEEALNSDATLYGGSNLGNTGGRQSEPIPMHGRPQSISLTLPPLSILVMRLRR
jgi:1,4-alpha-glucan branching enzyme